MGFKKDLTPEKLQEIYEKKTGIFKFVAPLIVSIATSYLTVQIFLFLSRR